jgi:hypothetical protein
MFATHPSEGSGAYLIDSKMASFQSLVRCASASCVGVRVVSVCVLPCDSYDGHDVCVGVAQVRGPMFVEVRVRVLKGIAEVDAVSCWSFICGSRSSLASRAHCVTLTLFPQFERTARVYHEHVGVGRSAPFVDVEHRVRLDASTPNIEVMHLSCLHVCA